MHCSAILSFASMAIASPIALSDSSLHNRLSLWSLYPRSSPPTLHDLTTIKPARPPRSAYEIHAPTLIKRQNTTSPVEFLCATDKYGAEAVQAAAGAACKHIEAGTQVGENDYPHEFQNREDFPFTIEGPYQEFPIMDDGEVYDGGSPGPDRIVVTEEGCQVAGGITHTGASGNDFLQCTRGANALA